MKAIILARVSSKDQEDGQSIPAQINRIKDYTAKKGLIISETHELTESSTKENRKKFERIIKVIEVSKEPIALIVETIDRLQRDFRASVTLGDMVKKGKLEIHFLRENLVVSQMSNSSDLLRWDIGVVFARSYVNQLSDNVKRSFEQKLKNGEWIREAPIGYIHIAKEKGPKDIVLDPVKAHLIKKIYEFYASGNYSMITLAKKMKELGLRGKSGKVMGVSMIEYILKNKFYYGIMDVNKREYPHKYEPIISLSLYKKVSDVREGRNFQPFKHEAKHFIFRGLIKCHECGSIYTPELKKKKYVYYSCAKRFCPQKRQYVIERLLTSEVEKVLKSLILPQHWIDEITKALKGIAESENNFHTDSMNELKAEYDRLQLRVSKMYDDKLDGSITSEMYDNKFTEYKSRQSEILVQMKEHNEADKNFYMTASTLLDLSKRAYDIFISSETFEKRQLVNFIFQNSRMQGKKWLYDLKEPFNIIAENSKHPIWQTKLEAIRTYFLHGAESMFVK